MTYDVVCEQVGLRATDESAEDVIDVYVGVVGKAQVFEADVERLGIGGVKCGVEEVCLLQEFLYVCCFLREVASLLGFVGSTREVDHNGVYDYERRYEYHSEEHLQPICKTHIMADIVSEQDVYGIGDVYAEKEQNKQVIGSYFPRTGIVAVVG